MAQGPLVDCCIIKKKSQITSSCAVLIHAGWDRAWSSQLHKRSRSLYGRENMTFSEHVVVMVAKAFAMLGFIRRLSLEFRDSYNLKSFYTSLVGPKLEFASCVCTFSIMMVLTKWNACKGALFNMLWVVWVEQTCLIFHRMRTYAPFCIFAPLQKSNWLHVWCLFSMFWVGELTHQTCYPFSIWSHHDIRLTVPSFCVLISIERTMDFMNQCRVRCNSLAIAMLQCIVLFNG
jgi:hypothetical protein